MTQVTLGESFMGGRHIVLSCGDDSIGVALYGHCANNVDQFKSAIISALYSTDFDSDTNDLDVLYDGYCGDGLFDEYGNRCKCDDCDCLATQLSRDGYKCDNHAK